jgi:hypothetical protein
MSSIIISNVPPFGSMTNQTIAELHAVNEAMARLSAAIATAQSGWTGEAGTEFEGTGNNFGVSPSDTPGAQGQAYAFALGNLSTQWTTFWTAAQAFIDAVDNGVRSP